MRVFVFVVVLCFFLWVVVSPFLFFFFLWVCVGVFLFLFFFFSFVCFFFCFECPSLCVLFFERSPVFFIFDFSPPLWFP